MRLTNIRVVIDKRFWLIVSFNGSKLPNVLWSKLDSLNKTDIQFRYIPISKSLRTSDSGSTAIFAWSPMRSEFQFALG